MALYVVECIIAALSTRLFLQSVSVPLGATDAVVVGFGEDRMGLVDYRVQWKMGWHGLHSGALPVDWLVGL